jgi:hypothetical protein
LAALSIAIELPKANATSGDTTVLVRGAPTIITCLRHGVFTSCLHYSETHHIAGVSKFPLLQTVPALFFHGLGLAQAGVVTGLRWLSFFAVLGLAVAVGRWCYRRSGLPLAVLGLLMLVPGMMLAYSVQSLAEALAATALSAVVLCSLRADKVSPWLIPAAVVATVSKETAAPFVFLFGLAAIVASGAPARVGRRAVAALAIGAGVGLLLNAAFNLFRYDSLINIVYWHEARSSLGMVPVTTGALLVSPNGGIIWFWPGVAVAMGILVYKLFARDRGDPLRDRRRAAAALGLLSFVGYAVSLADWWDPMGWYAWGPRLFAPAACALVVLALGTVKVNRAWQPRWTLRLGALGVASALVLLPSLAVVFGLAHQSSMIDATRKYRPVCQQRNPAGSALWGSCFRTEQWRMVDMPLTSSVPKSVRYDRYWLTFALASATLFVWIGRTETRTRNRLPTG